MVVYGDHNVSIADTGFYAQKCKSAQPFQAEKWDTVEIEKGLPRVYPCGTKPRDMTFTVTDNSGNRFEFRRSVESIKGIQAFTSDAIGSFRALIEVTNMEFPDGKPGVTVVDFKITEVRS